MKKLCADLFSRIGEAWGVLGDDARRAQYVEDLVTGAGVSVDVMGILQAETIFQTGTLLVKARQYEEAAAKFSRGHEAQPGRAGVRHVAGLVRVRGRRRRRRRSTPAPSAPSRPG